MIPLFIAEVSSNHGRDLDRCLAFIDKAAEIGCDGAKFQLFRLDELFAPEVLAAKPEVRKRKQWELPVEFLPALADRCREHNILFGCTPFYLDAVEEMLPHVDFFKIASYELLWDDLLAICVGTEKPLVLSTGMATMDEIRHAVAVVSEYGRMGVSEFAVKHPCRPKAVCSEMSPLPHSHTPTLPNRLSPLTLLHCVSGYPVPSDQCNLAAIETLRRECVATLNSRTPILPYSRTISVGWSDHSVSPEVIKRAVGRWAASMIEFHLDLDGTGAEYGAGHCWLPEQIGPVIKECRGMGAWECGSTEDGASDSLAPTHPHTHTPTHLPLDGDGVKAPVPSELPDRDWRADPADGLRPLKSLRRSLAAAECAGKIRAGSDVAAGCSDN